MTRIGWAAAAAVLLLGTSSGCTDQIPRSLSGDLSRSVAPVPACVMHLPARSSKSAGTPSLKEHELWELVFPGYDAERRQLPEGAKDCAGRNLFGHSVFEGGKPHRGWPLPTEEGDIVFGAGGSKLRVLWMRTHTFPDGTMAGPLAMVRVLDDKAEVYAMGALRGPANAVKLRLPRMGSLVVVAAKTDGCKEELKPLTPCRSEMHVFLPHKGELVKAATFATRRVGFAQKAEPGIFGTVRYELTGVPEFHEDHVRVLEEVMAYDAEGRELRAAELDRSYRLKNAELVESEPSLWYRLFDETKAVGSSSAPEAEQR